MSPVLIEFRVVKHVNMCCRLSERCLSLWVRWDSPRIRSSRRCRRGTSPLRMLQSGERSSVMENYWYLVWCNECPWINVTFPSAAVAVMGSFLSVFLTHILPVFSLIMCLYHSAVVRLPDSLVCWWKSLASELHLTFNNLHFVHFVPHLCRSQALAGTECATQIDEAAVRAGWISILCLQPSQGPGITWRVSWQRRYDAPHIQPVTLWEEFCPGCKLGRQGKHRDS